MKKYSIQNIADELGVSKTTVSFVVNKRDANISEQTRKRILDFVKKVGYKPNSVAKALKEGKTNTIAYLVPDISNPFYGNIARKIERKLEDTPYQLIIGSTDESHEKEGKIIRNMLDRQADGFIIASCNIRGEELSGLLQSNYPLVLFDRNDREVVANYVIVESKHAIDEGIKSWLKTGIRKIGLLSITPEISSLKDRIEGFRETITGSGLDMNPEFIRTVDKDNLRESTARELGSLLEKGVEALFFTNNLVATETIWQLRQNFKEHQSQLKLLSFDNIDVFDLIKPAVSSIAQPTDEIAEIAVKRLLHLIQSKEIHYETNLLKPKIIYR